MPIFHELGIVFQWDCVNPVRRACGKKKEEKKLWRFLFAREMPDLRLCEDIESQSGFGGLFIVTDAYINLYTYKKK